MLLLAFPDNFYRRYQPFSGSAQLLKIVFKYFFLLGNFSMQSNSIALVGIYLLFWRKLHYFG